MLLRSSDGTRGLECTIDTGANVRVSDRVETMDLNIFGSLDVTSAAVLDVSPESYSAIIAVCGSLYMSGASLTGDVYKRQPHSRSIPGAKAASHPAAFARVLIRAVCFPRAGGLFTYGIRRMRRMPMGGQAHRHRAMGQIGKSCVGGAHLRQIKKVLSFLSTM